MILSTSAYVTISKYVRYLLDEIPASLNHWIWVFPTLVCEGLVGQFQFRNFITIQRDGPGCSNESKHESHNN